MTQFRRLLALAAATSFCVPEIFISLDSSNVPSDSLSQVILAPEALQMERIVSPPLPTFNNTADPVWVLAGLRHQRNHCVRIYEEWRANLRRERRYGDPRRTEGRAGPRTPPAWRGLRHWPGWLRATSLSDHSAGPPPAASDESLRDM